MLPSDGARADERDSDGHWRAPAVSGVGSWIRDWMPLKWTVIAAAAGPSPAAIASRMRR